MGTTPRSCSIRSPLRPRRQQAWRNRVRPRPVDHRRGRQRTRTLVGRWQAPKRSEGRRTLQRPDPDHRKAPRRSPTLSILRGLRFGGFSRPVSVKASGATSGGISLGGAVGICVVFASLPIRGPMEGAKPSGSLSPNFIVLSCSKQMNSVPFNILDLMWVEIHLRVLNYPSSLLESSRECHCMTLLIRSYALVLTGSARIRLILSLLRKLQTNKVIRKLYG